MPSSLILYHTGFDVLPFPDIHHGRVNADFGQGFYLSPQKAFACRWARSRPGQTTWLNRYELALDRLKVMYLQRDIEWFNFIRQNRSGQADAFNAWDVIIGPIANDTLYNTHGILSSGWISPTTALAALQLGPVYEQVVLKTDKAAQALRFLEAQEITTTEISGYRQRTCEEEESFLAQLSALIDASDESSKTEQP